jgi:hypothetical protein
MSRPEFAWVRGDLSGLSIPADIQALREGGEAFLTDAFHSSGALAPDNSVARITVFEECPGGSTGRKLFLSLVYDRPAPDLPTDLFVKFSRDFDDPIRDRGKDQMESEVRFAALSRARGFPIAVPTCLFADYHAQTQTGLLITQKIPFGEGEVEPHHDKCLDDEMPEPLEHYRALVMAVARLAGTHKAGRLAGDVDALFGFDAALAAARDPIRYDARQVLNRLSRWGAFAAKHPGLVPQALADPAFIARLKADAPRFLEHERAIKRFLHADPDVIALCHWNANVDNAWFWRGEDGALRCGLMDWGRVGQMNVALALWGAFSAAEPAMLEAHLDDLLALFVAEYRAHGGPDLDVADVALHLELFVATMGLAWLMDAPALIEAWVPELDVIRDRHDPRLRQNEAARTQLHMATNFLNLWRVRDFGAALDRFVRLGEAS